MREKKKIFDVLEEDGISLEDVANSIRQNMEFSSDGHYTGMKNKSIMVKNVEGKEIKFYHGGSFSIMNFSRNKNPAHSCTKKGFWGGVLGGIAAVLFLGSG